ncbi:MAG: hypothetical protein JNL11_08920 [Bdellovibrionaceae bacterium]|nr:hypothetical protein [Pseudobdellovibrionaceae bacterium]
MHSVITPIKDFISSQLGADFHIEIMSFKTQSSDPFEKKTKNRFDLRTRFYNYLKEEKNFVFEDVLDLRNVPQSIAVPGREYYSSLSHTEDTGVFVLDSSPIGVDYENRERILQDIVKRVSRESEFNLNPDFQLLWSIKEAAFKAIPFIIQPKTISEIVVNTIEVLGKHQAQIPGFEVHSFSASTRTSPKTKIHGYGISNATVQLVVAKALIKK